MWRGGAAQVSRRACVGYAKAVTLRRNSAAAIAWIEENQLGRRNLTADQFAYFIGEKYNRLKKAHGGTGANQHTKPEENDDQPELPECFSDEVAVAPVEKEQRAQIAPFAKTAERVAIEHGVNQATVHRSADYSRAVNAIAPLPRDVPARDVQEPAGASAQIEHLEKSAERVAREHGVDERTVRRSADYSRAVNAIAEVAGDAAVCIDGIPLIKRDGSRFL